MLKHLVSVDSLIYDRHKSLYVQPRADAMRLATLLDGIPSRIRSDPCSTITVQSDFHHCENCAYRASFTSFLFQHFSKYPLFATF